MVLTAVIFNILLILLIFFPNFVLAVAVRQTLELSELLLLYVASYRIGSLEGNLAMTTSPT